MTVVSARTKHLGPGTFFGEEALGGGVWHKVLDLELRLWDFGFRVWVVC